MQPPGLIGPCPLLPANNIWNVRVDNLPVDPNSDNYIQAMGAATGLHPDFGSAEWEGGPIGIPYNLVPGGQPGVTVQFDYADESDSGPYPIPVSPKIEWGGDHHILIVDQDHCTLYEMWDSRQEGGNWYAGSGAIFDLNSNALRHDGWTSADAAGLPILPGLARYEEVASGAIRHALRFTVRGTQYEHYLWPARHWACTICDPNMPPMGQRFRLKASFNISSYSPQTQIILQALKTYGMIVADNGTDWYISGAPDPGWRDDYLVDELSTVLGSDFEAVDESSLMVDPNSGEVHINPSTTTGSATDMTQHSAKLNGTVNPNGDSTTYYFQWGPTTSYGNTTPTQSAGSGTSDVAVSANLTGLTPNTTYHYRLVAVNSAGTTNGSDMTFKTKGNAMPWLLLLLGD